MAEPHIHSVAREPPKQIFTYHDHSALIIMRASEIAQMDVWNGNRILDFQHLLSIRREIGEDIKKLDRNPFHIVKYFKEDEPGRTELVHELVDGQHRASVLRLFFNGKNDWVTNDFDVLCVVKLCANEQAIIDYFRRLNHTKAIQWEEDPNMIANRYLDALLRRFNSPAKTLIRQGKTRAPYISVDEVRQEILRRRIGIGAQQTPEEWANTIWRGHQEGLNELREAGAVNASQETALKAGCVLALFKNMDWLEPS